MSDKEPIWYEPSASTPQAQCLCCDYISLPERGTYLICPICFWEDSGQDIDELDLPSSSNHGLTLREGRNNFIRLGVCQEAMVKYLLSLERRKRFAYQLRKID
ncbi:MAG: hypothetical protein HY231_00745 [Acidobacteria bacterium]|nr:hypothetical protein [Acidobacteriota bacterium]